MVIRMRNRSIPIWVLPLGLRIQTWESIVVENSDQKPSYESKGLSAGLAGYDHGAASGALQNLVALKGNRASGDALHPEEIVFLLSSYHLISPN